MTIKFFLKTPKKPISVIYIDVKHAGQERVRIPIGVKMNPDYWNKKKSRVKAIKEYPNHIEINAFINDVETKVENEIRNNGFIFDTDFVKNILNENFLKDKSLINKLSFLDYLEKLIEKKEVDKNSKYLLKKLNEYKESLKLSDLTFPFFDANFNDKFSKFCIQEKGLQSSSYELYLSYLRTALDKAYTQGIHKNAHYNNYKYKSFNKEKFALTEEQLERIERADLKAQKYRYVRDLFLIECYTSLRMFSDVYRIDYEKHVKEQDGMYFLSLMQEKTKKKVQKHTYIPLSEKAHEIIKRIGKFQYIPTSTFSDRFKKMLELAGLTEVITQTIEEKGVLTTREVRLCDVISSHFGRVSYITDKSKLGIPPHILGGFIVLNPKTISDIYNKTTSEQYAKLAIEMLKEKK